MLRGEGFTVYLWQNNPNHSTKTHVGAQIEIAKDELDPKLLEKATKAVETALGRDFDVTKALLRGDTKKINGSSEAMMLCWLWMQRQGKQNMSMIFRENG
ncbi:hypothetical protein DQX05_12605 [Paenibacillus thiaminolyticus]|uniref:Uncharacterized protein n=1 Tax=Paenibacillus thiaminolyticus TaxID=49283 RepID=A0A3A3GGS7_PANTH|nr:hypothetical protein DQX05_12605 [Paenibacillus thiaminolyticus]